VGNPAFPAASSHPHGTVYQYRTAYPGAAPVGGAGAVGPNVVTFNRLWRLHPHPVFVPVVANWFNNLLHALRGGLTGALGPIWGAKAVPRALMVGAIPLRRELLAGYIDGDGSPDAVGHNHGYSIGTAAGAVELEMANHFMHVCRGLGFLTGATANATHWLMAPVPGAAPDANGDVPMQWTQFPGIQYRISGVPMHPTNDPGAVADQDPTFIHTRMPYKRVRRALTMAGANADEAWPNASVFSLSTVPHLFRVGAVVTQAYVTNIGASYEYIGVTVAGGQLLLADGTVVHNSN
jgi:hypothetical protein